MSRICILGDTHFGARGDSPQFSKHFKKFYDEVFFPYLEQNQIKYVIQLGDVFDRRKFINYQTLHHAKQYFFDRLNRDYKSWVLVGNHDTYYKNTNDVNSPSLLMSNYENITLIQDNVYETSFDGTSILFVPWISPGNSDRILKDMRASRSQICVGHFEISGFEMHRGAVCDDGMGIEVFDKFDQVISGHFHTRSKNSNITYTGTPYQMTWSDYDDPKGFHILDTSTRELDFIRNPYDIFHKVYYDDLDKQLDDVVNVDISAYNECVIKVVVKNKNNPYWFDMFIEKLEQVNPISMQVVEDHLNLDLVDDSDIIDEAEDTLTILNKYVGGLELGVDKQKLESLLHNLYNEAVSMETA